MNARYAYFNQQLLSKQINWLSDTFKVVLIDTNAYFVNTAIHRTLSDVPVVARIAVSGPLTSTSATDGVARAADLTIPTVSGPVIGAWIIFHDSGVETTSELVCYIDTANGLPNNPQGSNVDIHWDTGPNGIFKL